MTTTRHVGFSYQSYCHFGDVKFVRQQKECTSRIQLMVVWQRLTSTLETSSFVNGGIDGVGHFAKGSFPHPHSHRSARPVVLTEELGRSSEPPYRLQSLRTFEI